MNRGINLLREKKQVTLSPALKKLRILRIIALGFLFTISCFSIILFLLIALSPLPSLQQQEKNSLSTISQYHPDMARLELIVDRLKSSMVIIQNRNNFDQTLSEVRDMMPNGLTIVALNMQEKKISLTVTSQSLTSMDTFITNLTNSVDEKKNFSQVFLAGLITDEQRKLYTLTIDLFL